MDAVLPDVRPPAAGGAETRLMELYWNRAQLKKEFAALRDERFRLLEALTEQEGRTARYRQKLEYLEDLLGDADTADNTVAFFTLARLWKRCAARLVAFSGDLTQQRRRKEAETCAAVWRDDVTARVAAAKQRLTSIREKRDADKATLERLSAELDDAGGLTATFRRKRLKEDVDTARRDLDTAEYELATALKQLTKLNAERPPEPPPLSLRSRRAINFTVIALAEKMADHFGAAELSDLARQTLSRSVGTVRFGAPDTCRAIVRQVHECVSAFEKLEKKPGFVKALTVRAREIQAEAQFDDDGAAVPNARSLIGAPINVLESDLWDVNQAMIV
ncbi:MAG: hypothetical protein AAFX10_13095 [Pseudomonadota bacterium]